MNFYITATCVTILSILLFWLIFKRDDLKVSLKRIFLYGCISLFLSPVVNMASNYFFCFLLYKFKAAQESVWFGLGILSILTSIGAAWEEIIKILPLLIVRIVRIMDEKKVIYFLGLILGLGFGISEAWYLAFFLAQNIPQHINGFQNLLMTFLGFGTERLLAIFIHIFLTGIVAFGMTQRSFFKYFMLAVLFHSIINFPPALYQVGLLPEAITFILLISLFCILVLVFFKITGKIKRTEVLYEK